MNLADKAKNKAQELGGKAKEFVGDKTDDTELEAEGVGDQAEAGTRQAGEHLKDAAKNVKDDLTK